MNTGTGRFLKACGILLTAASTVWAYDATTTRVGTIDYVEGNAYVNGKAARGSGDKLATLENGDSLRTEKGHAEMLLTPGVFLRLGYDSQVQLMNDSITDARLRLDRGSAMLEVDELHKDNLIQVDVGGKTVQVLKTGLYRLNFSPPGVQVIKGKAALVGGDGRLTAGKNRQIVLSSTPSVEKFKPGAIDDLARWSRLRSEYEAEASVSSAQYIYDTGWPWAFSGWYWNPWFTCWTWVPTWGPCVNPYGFAFFSPVAVYHYYPGRYYGFHHYAFAANPGVRGFRGGPRIGPPRIGVPHSVRSGMAPRAPMMRPSFGGGRMGAGRR